MSAAGIYVHLPFCASICPYCDFAVLKGRVDERASYVETLLQEIRLCPSTVWPDFCSSEPTPVFDTVYLGGGTPSLLSHSALETLLGEIQDRFEVAANPWIAMEVNPEDATRSNLAAWKRLGVQYLSLGVQSFDEAALHLLGRRHDPAQAARSVAEAKGAGFHTVSIDLIYCRPGQTVAGWRLELERALELIPDHISCYALTVEPGTPFAAQRQRGSLVELSEELQADLFFTTHRTLEEHGYQAYEVSNFTRRSQHRSKHNQKYWTRQPYLGLGLSAHSFAGTSRWWNHRRLGPYRQAVGGGQRPILEHEDLDNRQLCLEAIALGLRTRAGVDLDEIPGDLGPEVWARNRPLIGQWVEKGLIDTDRLRLRPSLEGMAVADALTRQLEIPAE